MRAAILESEYGRGLYYASGVSRGREIGYYDGVEVTLQQYNNLDEYTGLRHTLEVGGKMINGIHGVTGMQYANTSRGGVEDNNAQFQQGTATVRVSMTGGVVRGQPVLLPYKWTPATWAEIDSRVIGMCAYEERGGGQGMGKEGGIYIIELASALRRGGLATQMLREARKGWARGKGRVELQVHDSNVRARRYYERLGMHRCAGGGIGERGGGQRERREGHRSLYEPRPGFGMMRVEAEELERALEERETARAPVLGVEFVRAQGVQGLKEAGVLQGVRAMSARVYAGEDWYVHDEGGTGRIECLYERARTGAGVVQYVVARLTDDDRWARDRRLPEGRDDNDEGEGGAGGSGDAGLSEEGGGGRGGDAGEDGRGRGDCGVSGGVGMGADGGGLAGAADGAAGGGECSVEAGGGKDVDDDRDGVRDGGGRAGAGRQTSVHKRSRGGGEKADSTGGRQVRTRTEPEGVLGGEEWVGRGEKRGRGGWEADRVEGRQKRTRTDQRGGRKCKKGDG